MGAFISLLLVLESLTVILGQLDCSNSRRAISSSIRASVNRRSFGQTTTFFPEAICRPLLAWSQSRFAFLDFQRVEWICPVWFLDLLALYSMRFSCRWVHHSLCRLHQHR